MKLYPLIKLYVRGALAVCFVAIWISHYAQATVVKEASWQPVAGAYLGSVFALNLDPVDWALVARSYEEKSNGQVPFDILTEVTTFSGDNHVKALRSAIAKVDRAMFYKAATRATSQTLRFYLNRAAANLAQPGAASGDVQRAWSVYRAFASFIRQADPPSYRRLGLAWIDLADSVGHAGVAGIGTRSAKKEAFKAARTLIEQYMVANYEDPTSDPRVRYDPVPEQILARGDRLEIDPWLPPGSDLHDQSPLPRLVLNFEQYGVDERDLFLVTFGDMLFDSPEFFGQPAAKLGITCATCHNRSDVNQRFMIPGLSSHPGTVDVDSQFFNAHSNDHRNDPIDIPSLRGIRFTAPYGRDGRTASLREFTRDVIVREFGGFEPTPLMLDALVAYMNEFDFLPPQYLQANGALNQAAPAAAQRGAALFRKPFAQMDGQSCASCHTPSAHFRDGLAHNIGSGGAFDTPTLLNIKYTAPYFHDGSLSTLEQVVDWFDTSFDLALSGQERIDLNAYLHAVGTTEVPYERFDDHFTPFRLSFEELSVFLSSLDGLILERDTFHTSLLLRTVARDLKADAVNMTAIQHKSKVFELVAQIEALSEAVSMEQWQDAERLWATYQALESKYDPYMR